ncbi:MAG: 50S ribosomal protein L11 [Candidatus Zambryskibacteria bacterium RIFCSPLOWO2_01_FULL_43_17]|uniref:Large ribosomal subunit protein uL11 n=1 Tax=Candidatus Zambryskibacteria bacterium RIFCSPLOWO2_01_FULL_43_17 TaxID=1802760 RepID=A0A1G2U6J1_9BACT|nr:MAG: 50S ribosomal protein L11 [Candidatus Zambryskibacteria bacterium RIFCSPLOWO2_01_FULL_43_17]
MAKKITKKLKVVLPAGKATPAPPVGPVLGQAGLNIGQFITEFNNATREMIGQTIPAEITVYEDRSYTFILKTPPASSLILQAIGAEKGSGKPNTAKIGKLTKAQLKEIAEKKMPDLNANDIEAGMKVVAGTARQMGVETEI